MNSLDFNVLQNFFQSIMMGLPNVLSAIGVFIIGFIVAKLVRRLVKTLLLKIKIDKLTDKLNEIEIISKANMKILPSVVLSTILYYFILIIFLIAATDILKMPTISKFLEQIINYVPKALTAIALMVIGVLFSDFVRKMVYTAGKSIGMPAARIISTVVFYFLFLNVFISSLAQAGIDTEFIQANLTMIIGGIVVAFGVGYGLASKDILSNILASFYNKKIHEGDYITIGEYTGRVERIDQTDIVLVADAKKIIIPLAKLTREDVTIHTDKRPNNL